MMTCAAIGLLLRVSYEVSRAENAMRRAIAAQQLMDASA
jgi:cell division protein FtsW